MGQEVEELISELFRLFGRLRYTLMEAQSNLAMIAGKARDKAGGSGERVRRKCTSEDVGRQRVERPSSGPGKRATGDGQDKSSLSGGTPRTIP